MNKNYFILILAAMILLSSFVVTAIDQTLVDQSREQNYNLTNQNAVYDVVSRSYIFNGINSTLNTTIGLNITHEGNFTVSAWAIPYSCPAFMGIVSQENPSNTKRDWYMGMNSCVTRYAIFNRTQGSVTTNQNTYPANNNFHTMLMYDNISNIAYRIENGTVVGNTTTLPGGIGFTANQTRIGYFGSTTFYFNGSIDDVRFWNITLTSAQRTAAYNNLSVACQYLNAWFPFTNGTETCNSYCTYQGSGNWYMGGYEACTITTNTNVLTNQFIVNGTGTASITNANITNVTSITAIGGATITVSGGGRLG